MFAEFATSTLIVPLKMHACLHIVEVQRIIFHEVYYQPRGTGALARLARTCRAFNNVALDVLWETLDSFVWLIQCLPRDLWKIDPADRKMVRSHLRVVTIVRTDLGTGLPTTHVIEGLGYLLQTFLPSTDPISVCWTRNPDPVLESER